MPDIGWWPLLAGLGLFLFGMRLMEEALSRLAGRPFKLFLRKHTEHPVKAILAGTLTTAVLQSSTLVTLLVMSFTGAGIIGLKNAIGIILGANLGTTFTGWIISLLGFKLNIHSAVLPVIAAGGLGTVFLKTERLLSFSKFLMGFGFLFMGLEFMKNSFSQIAENFPIRALQGQPLFVFLIAGFLLTAAIQSSSASVAIYLSAMAAGIVQLPQGAFLVMGSDLGTTVTALMGTVRANAIKKKTGYAHFFINVIQILLALMLWKGYFFFIHLVGITDPLVALVFFQSLMNLAGILVLTPWLAVFTAGIDRLINPARINHSQFIDQTNPAEVVSALEALNKEVKSFAKQSVRTLMQMFETDNGHSYSQLKEYENEITRFYLLTGQHAMNKAESERLNNLSMSVRHWSLAVKDMKDVKHNYDTLQHSALEGKYRLYMLMRDRQKEFYRYLLTFLEDESQPFPPDTTAQLRSLHHQLHVLFNTEANRLFQGDAREDIDYSSVMNLLRETGNSNESLLQALDLYIRSQQIG